MIFLIEGSIDNSSGDLPVSCWTVDRTPLPIRKWVSRAHCSLFTPSFLSAFLFRSCWWNQRNDEQNQCRRFSQIRRRAAWHSRNYANRHIPTAFALFWLSSTRPLLVKLVLQPQILIQFLHCSYLFLIWFWQLYPRIYETSKNFFKFLHFLLAVKSGVW